ncbi:MAG: hypothetical protein Q8P53_01845 [Candidatus Shapirobacteria bacterium]|nr:hypothetical protein [Candidatus Shapirobacteria bacterium]
MKKIIYAFIIALVVFAVYKLVSYKPNINSSLADDKADIILFWGNGCVHCEKVKKYIIDNKIDSKLAIKQKEVFYNKQNQMDFTEITKKCTTLTADEKGGVPLAFSNIDNTCISGDTPIIDYIQQQITKR